MIDTPRLLLRPWHEADLGPFQTMSRDPEVMLHLGPLSGTADVTAAYERMVALQAERGFCFWAIERKSDGSFIGFCGLKPGKPPIEGEIEIGWRLARDAWGQGFAREAAEASLAWGWANLDVPTIVAITVPPNIRSWGLMERLSMTRHPDEDFLHPDLPHDSPLRPHILYRIARPHVV